MAAAPAELLLLAETASVYEPLKEGEDLVVDDRYVVSLGIGAHPEASAAHRLRFQGDVEPQVADVRALVRGHGGAGLLWHVSSAAMPVGLADDLLALGAVPGRAPSAVAMALVEPPSQAPADVSVSRVESADDFRTYVSITHEVFEMQDRLPEALAQIERDGERVLADRRFVRYVAWVDGEPAGAASAAFAPAGAILHAGSTRVSARGRGAYRALVRARWDDAAARGAPALVTWAGAMSEPILRRLGFQEVGRVQILLDELRD